MRPSWWLRALRALDEVIFINELDGTCGGTCGGACGGACDGLTSVASGASGRGAGMMPPDAMAGSVAAIRACSCGEGLWRRRTHP
eukprot:6175828-Pleurochrysis_carterae.AAC.2